MVADLNRKAFDGGVERGALRHRPRAHHPVHLQAQIEVAGGGGVLLDDEGAGTDAADRELLVALDLDRRARHLGDPCGGRPLLQESHQFLHRRLRPLGVDEQVPVLPVAHPAHDAQLVSPPQRRVAKPDALHLAVYGRAQRH